METFKKVKNKKKTKYNKLKLQNIKINIKFHD